MPCFFEKDIEGCIKQAIGLVCEKQKDISEIILESDSRNEIGTPDLSATIFNKIDCCDIFVADISLINPKTNERITPNPNVMIELGYAAKALGWSNILCVYNTSKEKTNEKQNLTKFISKSIIEIIEKRLLAKIIYALRNYKQIIMSDQFLDFKQTSSEYKVIAGKDLNTTNPPNTYLLLKVIDAEKGKVISSGNFEGIDIVLLLNIYSINNEMKNVYANCLYNIISIINDWIHMNLKYN